MNFGTDHLFALSLAFFAVVPLMAVELCKAARWRVLFGGARPPYSVCLRALVAGQLTNALSPFRAGEAVRLGVLAAQGGAVLPGAGALAGAKAIDAVSLAAIAAAVVGAASLASARLGLVGGAVVIAGGALVALNGRALRRQLDAYALTRKLRLTALVDVAETLRSGPTLLVVLSATAVVWGAGLAANGVVLAATGIQPTLDLMARVLVAGYIVGLVPAPPARLGVFETGVTVALTSAGVALPQAIAAAVTLHVCQFAELGLLLFAGVAARRWGRRTLFGRAST
jgi:uncharacterized membrane protein YbhN (UPF0104 family)